jgi:hypothetical protein
MATIAKAEGGTDGDGIGGLYSAGWIMLASVVMAGLVPAIHALVQ